MSCQCNLNISVREPSNFLDMRALGFEMHVALTRSVPSRIVEPDRSPRFAEATCKDFCNRLIRQKIRLIKSISGSFCVNEKAIDLLHFKTKLSFICGLVADLGYATVDTF